MSVTKHRLLLLSAVLYSSLLPKLTHSLLPWATQRQVYIMYQHHVSASCISVNISTFTALQPERYVMDILKRVKSRYGV